jgi:hypothetical protein
VVSVSRAKLSTVSAPLGHHVVYVVLVCSKEQMRWIEAFSVVAFVENP